MKTKSKVLLGISGALLLVAGSVAGTLAFLTASESVTNVFTIGKVALTLDEAVVDSDGKAIDAENQRSGEGNEYHLVPGKRYDKDPTITVSEDSEEAYVRMMLTVTKASVIQEIIDNDAALEDYADLFDGWDDTVWLYKGFTENKSEDSITFEFRYADKVSGMAGEQKLAPLFTELVAPGSITGEQMNELYTNDGNDDNDFKVIVEGHAIQAVGFDTADAAWTAFKAQEQSE
ncbi:MAG: SipW-dependent-type signal peptide-containing protein [Oscillospiraceae bacterium]|nr:SipW-dependent-type signal peptide-containing protein [Oscillospiraceae bacterium]